MAEGKEVVAIKNGHLVNAISTIGGVAFAIAMAYAIISSHVSPIQLQIDVLHSRVQEISEQMKNISELTIRADVALAGLNGEQIRHMLLPGHLDTTKELASQNVQFVEVETQFKNLDERTDRMQAGFTLALENLDAQLQREVAVQKAELEVIIANLNATSAARHQANKERITASTEQLMIHVKQLQQMIRLVPVVVVKKDV